MTASTKRQSGHTTGPLATEYPFLRRLWLRELRAVRRDCRAGHATFGDLWRATKTATALRYCAGLGLFACDPVSAPHVAAHTRAAIAKAGAA